MIANQHEDLVAQVTDIAYQTLLTQGLEKPFLDVELELWRKIKAALQEPSGAPRSARAIHGRVASIAAETEEVFKKARRVSEEAEILFLAFRVVSDAFAMFMAH